MQVAKSDLNVPVLHDTFQAVTMTFTGRYETKSATGLDSKKGNKEEGIGSGLKEPAMPLPGNPEDVRGGYPRMSTQKSRCY
jgi:hypothetical protein